MHHVSKHRISQQRIARPSKIILRNLQNVRSLFINDVVGICEYIIVFLVARQEISFGAPIKVFPENTVFPCAYIKNPDSRSGYTRNFCFTRHLCSQIRGCICAFWLCLREDSTLIGHIRLLMRILKTFRMPFSIPLLITCVKRSASFSPSCTASQPFFNVLPRRFPFLHHICFAAA